MTKKDMAACNRGRVCRSRSAGRHIEAQRRRRPRRLVESSKLAPSCPYVPVSYVTAAVAATAASRGSWGALCQPVCLRGTENAPCFDQSEPFQGNGALPADVHGQLSGGAWRQPPPNRAVVVELGQEA